MQACTNFTTIKYARKIINLANFCIKAFKKLEQP